MCPVQTKTEKTPTGQTGFLSEIKQQLKILLSFTGVTNNERCPQGKIWHGRAHLLDWSCEPNPRLPDASWI